MGRLPTGRYVFFNTQSIMTDNKLRGLLLNWYYEHRREGNVCPSSDDFGHQIDHREISRISHQLYEHNLIKASFATNKEIGPHGSLLQARISAHGIDVIEETTQAAIAISIDSRHVEDSRTFNISDSTGFQIGDYNTQNLAVIAKELADQIDNSDAPEPEKREAKKRLAAFLRHPLMTKLFGEVLTRVPSLSEVPDVGAV